MTTACCRISRIGPRLCRTIHNGSFADGVEQVVRADHHHAKGGDGPVRQIHQCGQRDHRLSQRPQNEQHRQVVIEVELKSQTAQRHQFDENQPQPARPKEVREFALRSSVQRKVRARADEQKEDGRAEVRDPAGEEQRNRAGFLSVGLRGTATKSRTWSSVITIMTAPRKTSTDSIRRLAFQLNGLSHGSRLRAECSKKCALFAGEGQNQITLRVPVNCGIVLLQWTRIFGPKNNTRPACMRKTLVAFLC